MRRVVATLIVAVVVVLIPGSAQVNGQPGCSFVRGFATLRELVGAQKVGTCLEDERFNGENGNAEQQTSGGLMVWRKADNFTAFTDGGTTWVNGPNGLQSRPNADRFAWEKDPPSSGRSSSSPERSAGPPSGPASSNAAAAAASAAAANAAPPAAASPAAAVSTPIPTATSTPTPALPTATATVTRTPTATPNPVTAKFEDKPDDVSTGQDVKLVVETTAKKGTCALTITYKSTAAAGIGTVDIDDGKCEWKFNVAETTKKGKARAEVVVTSTSPAGTASIDEDFEVKEGDEFLTGDINIDLEVDKFPEEARIGEEVEISISSDQGNKGSCELSINWPVVAATAGESKKTDDGKCTWKMVVPATITKKGTANVLITVRGKSGVWRSIAREFDVKLN